MKLLFFPGGPGFNSNPELHLLKEKYAEEGIDLIGWHEPSLFRPFGDPPFQKDAFQNYLDSAERFFLQHYTGSPLVLFAFCFGSHPVRYLLKTHPEKINHVLIITPDFCLSETDRNILYSIMNDYRQLDDLRAKQLHQILNTYSGRFDQSMEEGFRMAADNPRLFDYYWRNKKLMQDFVQFYTDEYQIDVEEFLAVRKSMFEIQLHDCSIPAVVIYGKYDKIISIKDEVKNLPKCFSKLKIIELSESSHYPHIEEPDKVLAIIKNEFMHYGVAQATF